MIPVVRLYTSIILVTPDRIPDPTDRTGGIHRTPPPERTRGSPLPSPRQDGGNPLHPWTGQDPPDRTGGTLLDRTRVSSLRSLRRTFFLLIILYVLSDNVRKNIKHVQRIIHYGANVVTPGKIAQQF